MESDHSGKFEFVAVSLPFKNLGTKEVQENFFKWGMASMEIMKFRFNKSFNAFNADEFLVAFFNSAEVRANLQFTHCLPRVVEKVEYEKLSTQVVNMEFFDVLYKKDICVESGYIKQEPDEFIEDV